MNFKHQIIICSIIITILSSIIFYQLNQIEKKRTKPYIVCTTSIIADVVHNIAQDKIELVTFMGPGIDPHLYKPVESDLLKILQADIIFYNGLHLEAQLTDLLEKLGQHQTTVAVTCDIAPSMLLQTSQFDGIFDPHVWFDVNLWIMVTNTICKHLVQKYPSDKDFYENNTQRYIQKLEQLLLQTHAIMNTIPQEKRILITGHDAFSYFGRQYHCKVIGLQGISTESCPGAYDLQKIIDLICHQNIPAIFIESSIPIKNILAIQEGVAAHHKEIKIGGEIYSDALGPKDSSGDTYINMMLHNVQTISSALISSAV